MPSNKQFDAINRYLCYSGACTVRFGIGPFHIVIDSRSIFADSVIPAHGTFVKTNLQLIYNRAIIIQTARNVFKGYKDEKAFPYELLLCGLFVPANGLLEL